MADCVSEIPMDLIPTKKNRSRKALKPKKPSENDTNIIAGMISSSSPLSSLGDAGKENQEALYSGKKTKATTKKKSSEISSFEKELEAMKGKFEEMRLEKEKTEELLKDRDEMLKLKEDELEIRGKEQEKLQVELKKLQKLKEFKPTMSLPLCVSLREKEQDKNEKTKKKKKGEMKLKKPSPAYVLWCKDQWVEMKKENPDADFKEISNKLGAKWKTVTAEEKKPYEETYQADKEAYLLIVGQEKREIEAMKLLEEDQKQKTAMELLEQYVQFIQEAEKEEETKKKKKTKKQKDPLKPKQPLSAFFVFSQDRRAALFAESKSAVEVAKTLGEEWKNMSEKKRRPYEETAKKQKEEYLQEMEIYNQKKDEEAATHQKEEEEQMKIQKQEAMQMLKKKEKTENIIKKTKENRQKNKKQKEVVDPNKPKRPASSFILFSKETRKNLLQERPGINNSSLTALISVTWKELSEEDKKVWNDEAAVAMESYKKELEEYNKSVAADAATSDDVEL